MIDTQHIVICVKDFTEEDPATYVQATRKRFTFQGAIKYASTIAPSRHPRIVPVPYARLDKNNYPVKSS